jgi:hypothetical protein
MWLDLYGLVSEVTPPLYTLLVEAVIKLESRGGDVDLSNGRMTKNQAMYSST